MIRAEERPHLRPRLLVIGATATALLGFFAPGEVDGRADVIFRVVVGAIPAIPLLARTPQTFRRICVIEGLLLIVIGFLGAIGGLFILIPSAMVLITAAFVNPNLSRWPARILGTIGAAVIVATTAAWLSEIHW